jgi:hypothetical protein
MKKKGFKHSGRTIYYIDGHGKDASFERWRVTLYYAPHYAETHFLQNEAEYNAFIANRLQHTYADFSEFCADAVAEGLKDDYCDNQLTAYRMTTDKGHVWETNMAAGITIEDAEAYFFGQRVDVGSYPVENMQTVVNVERIR